MALLPVSTKCPCGHEMKFAIRKPKFSEPAVKKLNCWACDSSYLLTCTRVKDPSGNRTFKSEFEIIDLSRAAREVLGRPSIATRVKRTVSKFIKLEEQGGIILTDMDQAE